MSNMIVNRKTLFGSAAIAVLFAMTGLAQATDLKMSHVRPQGTTIDKELHAFADAVKEATNDEVNISIFPANALGDSTTVQQNVSVGSIEMATQPAATDVDRRMQIASFPYLASDWDEASKIYGPDGVVSVTMKDLYAKQGITLLAVYPVYFGGISLNRAPATPGTVEAKGIKIRVPGIKSFQLTGEALGYIPAPIPFSDAYTAIQTGVVDGVIGSGAEGYYSSFRDVTKSYIPLNDHFEAWFMIINTETFDGLSEGDQAALTKTSKEFEVKRWDVAKADQAMWEKRLADDQNTDVVQLTDQQISDMAAKVRKDVWPVILKDIGEEWGQAILDKAAK